MTSGFRTDTKGSSYTADDDDDCSDISEQNAEPGLTRKTDLRFKMPTGTKPGVLTLMSQGYDNTNDVVSGESTTPFNFDLAQ